MKNKLKIKDVDNVHHTPHVVSLLIESSLFGLFSSMILYDQISSIIDDEVKIFNLFRPLSDPL